MRLGLQTELYPFSEEFKKLLFQIIPFQRIINGRFEESDLISGVISGPLHLEAVDIGLFDHKSERIGKTELPVSHMRLLEVFEDIRSQDVFSDDPES